MPISCHFRDCKALLVASLTHVSGAIASVQTFTSVFNSPRYNDTLTGLESVSRAGDGLREHDKVADGLVINIAASRSRGRRLHGLRFPAFGRRALSPELLKLS